MLKKLLFLFIFLFIQKNVQTKELHLDIVKNFKNLLLEEDTDGDKKITINDFQVKSRGDREFSLKLLNNKTYKIKGTYYLSNLLQILTLKKEHGLKTAKISSEEIFENPVSRTSRLIKNYYWKGLTRRIDKQNISKIITDDKLRNKTLNYLYVPANDSFAFNYFSNIEKKQSNLNLKVIKLPPIISPQSVKKLEGKHGLLALGLKNISGKTVGVPFVVPGGRFNEMYGWDSYFEALGLLVDGKIELAKSMVNNFIYEIENYGKILNANRTYYLTRSQPPFLTSMALKVYMNLAKDDISKKWLRKAMDASIYEYTNVWTDTHHLTATGLSRYYGTGIGIPPEVEPGHFKHILKPYAKKHLLPISKFEKLYNDGTIKEPDLDTYFIHDRAMRESGHDTTYRWQVNGENRCADFVTVDLNVLLYKYELDIAFMYKNIFKNNLKAKTWYTRAKNRKKLIFKYLWNENKKMFFDYNFQSKKQSDYISATNLYPLWPSQNPKTKLLSNKQAKQVLIKALKHLETNGGILSTAKISLDKYGNKDLQRQWDYPNGWAPHQMIIWQGLENYEYKSIADRLIYKWLYTITKNAYDYNGTIPEKFDIVKRSHDVFAEYGNVGTKFSYMTKEGFGWMNASYQVGLELLSTKLRKKLEKLIPPEQIKF